MQNRLSKVGQGLRLKTASDGTSSISLYTGILTDKGVLTSLKKLQVAFPKQSKEFFNILTERLAANGFTDERLRDAVNNVIDNFQYKELNISDVVKFDKRVKLYSYDEISDRTSEFQIVAHNRGHLFWAKRSDIALYGIPVTDIEELRKQKKLWNESLRG